MRQTIIDNEYASLYYYPDKKIVHHEWHRFVFGKYFREVLTRGAEILESNGCQKWLSDDRGNSALHPEDKAWGDENWAPRVIKAGWKYWALVMPENVIGQLNMTRIVNEYLERGVEVRVFSDPDEAMKWLESK